jgi:Flp pilus assembly pilin Flp
MKVMTVNGMTNVMTVKRMTNIMTKFDRFTAAAGRFCADESGATAIKYAMMASGIGAFAAATVYGLGGKVKNLYVSVSDLL